MSGETFTRIGFVDYDALFKIFQCNHNSDLALKLKAKFENGQRVAITLDRRVAQKDKP